MEMPPHIVSKQFMGVGDRMNKTKFGASDINIVIEVQTHKLSRPEDAMDRAGNNK